MGLSTLFIVRPIGTTLLTFGLATAGAVAFLKLPVSPLPQVDFPTISVQATLPGGSPQDVAVTVASPLERHLGQIADVTEMTSSSTIGAVRITLQFGLTRDINGAARDVQAAINAARADLPTSLRTNPTYRKVNPADAPILILALTSDTMTRGELYDAASTVLAQKLSQVDGIGEVVIGGGSLPAVRAELIPQALYKYGVGLEDVRAALSSANAHSPKGGIDVGDQRYQIYANDQANTADDYKSLVVAYRKGAPIRLSDVGEVTDSVENVRTIGLANGKPAILVVLYRQPGANIISTVDLVKGLMPQLRASISPAIDTNLAVDRSITIRTSLRDVERTLILAVLLVIAVVFAFLRSPRATLVPVVAVSVSLIATFAAMYLCGYSLDNLSLMALTVATGFVVDDAIVVLEGRQRGRIYRAVDEHLADRRLHPDPADGRHHRPDVPRIRDGDLDFDHNLACGLARYHADDVRGAAAQRFRRGPRMVLSNERALFRRHARRLSPHAGDCASTSRFDHAHSGHGAWFEYLSL
jgi:multidrug efflux pump